MSRGPNSTVYVLAKSAGADTHTSLGSTNAANVATADEGGTITLQICEDSTLTVTAMERAAAFALASPADEATFRIFRKTGSVMPHGAVSRVWSFTVEPTGQTFAVNAAFTYTLPFELA